MMEVKKKFFFAQSWDPYDFSPTVDDFVEKSVSNEVRGGAISFSELG